MALVTIGQLSLVIPAWFGTMSTVLAYRLHVKLCVTDGCGKAACCTAAWVQFDSVDNG